MKKRKPDYQDEMRELRRRRDNLEAKLDFTSEPFIVDALSYELLGVRARMDALFARAKAENNEIAQI